MIKITNRGILVGRFWFGWQGFIMRDFQILWHGNPPCGCKILWLGWIELTWFGKNCKDCKCEDCKQYICVCEME